MKLTPMSLIMCISFADQIFGHGSRESGVVFMAVGAAQQESLAVQLEGSVLDPFD